MIINTLKIAQMEETLVVITYGILNVIQILVNCFFINWKSACGSASVDILGLIVQVGFSLPASDFQNSMRLRKFRARIFNQITPHHD